MQLYLSAASTVNPDHHLFLQTPGRRVWWCCLTLRAEDGASNHLKFSLRTHNIEVARKRRDRMIADIKAYLSAHQGTPSSTTHPNQTNQTNTKNGHNKQHTG